MVAPIGFDTVIDLAMGPITGTLSRVDSTTDRPLNRRVVDFSGGNADSMSVLRTRHAYDLAALRKEASIASGILDYAQGPYGNSISLPSSEDVPPAFREHHNNVPFAAVFQQCSYLREIFFSFAADKVSYRLLRRGSRTAYALHDDRDKGEGVLRFQIPIITSPNAFLLLAHDDMDCSFAEAYRQQRQETPQKDICFDLAKLDQVSGGRFDLYRLEPGYLHVFDTNLIHTLINTDDKERIVLSIDMLKNDWLIDWIGAQLSEPVPPASVERTEAFHWEWNALRCGVIRN